MAETTITIRDNGPYRIEGPCRVVDADGNEYRVEGRIALCRCGLSANKPFCDATHRAQGFESAPRADLA
jgi:CDGSH-type Zn-finger protein